MRFLIVEKLVSMPPSQRLLTYGWLARVASWRDRLLGLLLRPDEQDLVAAGDGLADELEGDVEALDGLGEVDDVDPVALREDERASSSGFQRRVWWPKWTPASSSCRIETDGTVSDLLSVRSSADLVAGDRWPVGPAGTAPVGTVRV